MNLDPITRQTQHQADLQTAALIQSSLLPPRAIEKFEDISLAWTVLPLDQVSGDLLGYSWLDNNHLAAFLIDVCGHGLPAAVMAAAIAMRLAPHIENDEAKSSGRQRAAFSPQLVLEALDSEFPLERFERSFTISYLVLNGKTGEFRCSRAGHPMPIIVRKGGQLEFLEAGGTIIGLGHVMPFDESVGRLNAGDAILLYSDGVTECTQESRLFGTEGLSRVLQQCSGMSPEVVCERVLTALRKFNGGAAMRDDVTMLMLAYDMPSLVHGKRTHRQS
jgi:phosphoserine phosphatase RsbU/P